MTSGRPRWSPSSGKHRNRRRTYQCPDWTWLCRWSRADFSVSSDLRRANRANWFLGLAWSRRLAHAPHWWPDEDRRFAIRGRIPGCTWRWTAGQIIEGLVWFGPKNLGFSLSLVRYFRGFWFGVLIQDWFPYLVLNHRIFQLDLQHFLIGRLTEQLHAYAIESLL